VGKALIFDHLTGILERIANGNPKKIIALERETCSQVLAPLRLQGGSFT